MFLLVPAYPGCPGSKAVKRSLLLYHLMLNKQQTKSHCTKILYALGSRHQNTVNTTTSIISTDEQIQNLACQIPNVMALYLKTFCQLPIQILENAYITVSLPKTVIISDSAIVFKSRLKTSSSLGISPLLST